MGLIENTEGNNKNILGKDLNILNLTKTFISKNKEKDSFTFSRLSFFLSTSGRMMIKMIASFKTVLQHIV